jgi:hypothetical protein
MSDKKGWSPKTCGNCGRITKKDLSRKYCPISASLIHAGRSAASCSFYERGFDKQHRRERDVCEE